MWLFQFKQLPVSSLLRIWWSITSNALQSLHSNQWSSFRKKSVVREVIRRYLAKQKMWKSLRVAYHATNNHMVTWGLGQSLVPDLFRVMRGNWRFEENLTPSTNFFKVWFKIFITIIAPDIMSVTKETLPDIYTFCAGQCPCPATYFQAWVWPSGSLNQCSNQLIKVHYIPVGCCPEFAIRHIE